MTLKRNMGSHFVVYPFQRKLVFGFEALASSVALGSSLFHAVSPSRLHL